MKSFQAMKDTKCWNGVLIEDVVEVEGSMGWSSLRGTCVSKGVKWVAGNMWRLASYMLVLFIRSLMLE